MTTPKEIFEKNMAALSAGGQGTALKWLRDGRALGEVSEIEAANGEFVISAKGQTQASRHDPKEDARRWLASQEVLLSGDDPVMLFGFSSPWPAALILERGRALAVFEPDPAVARLVLSRRDFSESLAAPDKGLRLIGPPHLAESRPKGSAPALLAHPPSRRREPGQLYNLEKWLRGEKRRLSASAGRPLKIMVMPPLSGGSLPVAVAMARAAGLLGHDAQFMEWDAELFDMERAAAEAPPPEAARLGREIFSRCGRAAAEAARVRVPDLVLALAQAPLDLAALKSLRESSDAPLCFWFVEDASVFNYAAELAPAYDAFFHIQAGAIEARLSGWGVSGAAYLPLAADPDIFRPLAEVPEPFRAKLSFMGAGYPNRRRLLNNLAKDFWPTTKLPDTDYKVFGGGWRGCDRELAARLFEGGRRVETVECAMIYAGTQVNLNIHSSSDATLAFSPQSAFVNPRTFEIAAAGAFQIVDSRPLLPPLFEAGRELVAAQNPGDLPELIRHYLARPKECAAMGRAARERVLAEHRYTHRLEKILAHLGHRP